MGAPWQAEEQRKWADSVWSPTLRYVLYGFLCKTSTLALAGEIEEETALGLTVVCAAVHFCHRYIGRCCDFRLRFFCAIGLLETYQWLLAFVSLLSCPSHNVFYGLASAGLCLTYQISLTSTKLGIVFTLARVFLMWRLTIAYSDLAIGALCFFPLCLFLFMTVLTTGTNAYYQTVARNRFESVGKLVDREKKIVSLMQAIPDGLLVITQEIRAVSYNEALLALLETGEKTLEGVVRELKYESGETLIDGVKRGREGTLGITTVNGKSLQWRGRKCSWDDQSACILTVRDISEEVALQRQLQRESTYKSALIRSVSHELRTPTNAIINLIRHVNESFTLPEAAATDLQLAGHCCHFLLSMINDLLDYSKVLAGKFRLIKSEFVLRQELHDLLRLFDSQCKAKGVDLRLNIDPFLPEFVYSDVTRMKQVLMNLLSNAVKFTPSGCICLLATFGHEGAMQLSVSDTGIGIPAEKQKHIFTLFGKLDGNDTLNSQGSGLGLGISNVLAGELGGQQITVQSAPGSGAVFAFQVDIGCTNNINSDPHSPADVSFEVPMELPKPLILPRVLTAPNFLAFKHKAVVLVVDDSSFNRLVLRRILESFSVSCDEAESGLQALQSLSRDNDYALVLMDVEMPEMDGLTAARHIRDMKSDGKLSELCTVVACSAYSGDEDKQECARAGMSGYLEKPVSKETVKNLLLEMDLLVDN